MSGVDAADSTTNALGSDARPAFVTPRDLLQQSRAPLPPKEQPRQLSAIDREQLDGLVWQCSAGHKKGRGDRLTSG